MRRSINTSTNTRSTLPRSAASLTATYNGNHLSTLSSNLRFQSSFAEPEQTLFHVNRTKVSTDINELDKQLRSDVKTMGSILGMYYLIEPDH